MGPRRPPKKDTTELVVLPFVGLFLVLSGAIITLLSQSQNPVLSLRSSPTSSDEGSPDTSGATVELELEDSSFRISRNSGEAPQPPPGNSDRLNITGLPAALRQAAAIGPATLVVRPAPEVPYGDVVRTIATARGLRGRQQGDEPAFPRIVLSELRGSD